MPRKNRVHYRFALHHVMLRENNRKNIFFAEDDYQSFLDLIVNSAEAYNFKVHLYCLMTNHIHLVIEVADIPISRIMQSVTSRFANKHNKKYNQIGHLFQGRFKSKLIDNDYYLLELCHYIHMNPVKAKMCNFLDEYPWSSHFYYLSRIESACFKTDYVSKIISNHFNKTYVDFISMYTHCNFKPQFCQFSDDGQIEIKNEIRSIILNKPSLALENISLYAISKMISEILQISLEDISSFNHSKQASLARSIIAYFGHYHAKYTYADISAIVCREPNSISKTLRRHLKLASTDSSVKHKFVVVERRLSMSDVDIERI